MTRTTQPYLREFSPFFSFFLGEDFEEEIHHLEIVWIPLEARHFMVACDRRRHQSTTPRRRRSRHPRAPNLHNERRRGIPTSPTLHEDLVLPLYATPQAREHVDLSSLFIVNFSARTCLSGPLLISLSFLGFQVGSSLLGILFVKPFIFVNLLICMSMFRFRVMGLRWALSPLSPSWAL